MTIDPYWDSLIARSRFLEQALHEAKTGIEKEIIICKLKLLLSEMEDAAYREHGRRQ